MPNWEGIEDAATMLPRIWLTRAKDGDVWKPLRKIDCKALNESRGEEVLIEGDRATADPKNGTIRFNYVNRPQTKLMAATWFSKEEKSGNKKEFILQPLAEADSWQVELLYQNAVRASSSLGEGIAEILKEEIILESDTEHKVCVVQNGGLLCMRKRPRKSNFMGIGEVQYTLQRGYGQYTIAGEDDENALGDLTHTMFVIHGIGEAMWSKAEVSTFSMMDECDQLRMTVNKKKVLTWREECKKCERQKQPLPPPPNRIEFIPVMWYDKVRSPNHSLVTSLNAVTINSVPALRSIANDVIFDVLMYLTPEFCEAILQCVTTQIIELYSTFQRINPSFIARGGKFSLAGHSLGSVIAWDILSVLKDNMDADIPKGNRDDPIRIDVPASPPRAPLLATLDHGAADKPMGIQALAKGAENDSKHGTWGPCLPKRMTQTIPFKPDMTIFLGSPIGLFLTLRGAHPVFDEMRAVAEAERASLIPCDDEEADRPPPVFKLDPHPVICSPFELPTGAMYNVFHPSDPVAYRIEPLLLPEGVDRDEFPPPLFLSPDGRGPRLHVKARQVGDQIFKQFGSISNLFDKSVENAAAAAAAADAEAARKMATGTSKEEEEMKAKKKNYSGYIRGRDVSFRLGGRSTRVDLQLQPGVIDNEYLSAVTAHSNYFYNEDLVDFIIFNTRPTEEKKPSSGGDFMMNLSKQLNESEYNG